MVSEKIRGSWEEGGKKVLGGIVGKWKIRENHQVKDENKKELYHSVPAQRWKRELALVEGKN